MMGSLRFLLGAVFVYVGFLLFFVGFMNNAMIVPVFDEFGKMLLPVDMATPLRGSIIELAGGLLAVTGILICLSSPKQPAPSVIMQKAPGLQTPRAMPSTSTTSGTPASPAKCRFCGAPLRKEDAFCPSCKRSQT